MRRSLFSFALAAAAALGCTGAPAFAAVYVVTADGMRFVPEAITIYQGDTIRFVNVGGADNVHNVHADDNSFICGANCNTNTSPSALPWQHNVRFNRLGTLGYYCDQHGNLTSGMRGSITVIDRIFVDGFDAAPPASLPDDGDP